VLSLMLPKSAITQLKSGSRHCAAQFKEASVLFVEIADFGALSAKLPASELGRVVQVDPRTVIGISTWNMEAKLW